MPTIGIDYTPAYEQGGGIGRYVRELVAALTRQAATSNYKLFVAGASPTRLPPPPANNFIWKATPLTPTWLARIWHRAHIPIPVEVFTGSIDLYHATDFVLPPTRRSTRTLLTVHDLSFIKVPEATSPNLKAYLSSVVPRSARRADYILADSEATKNDLIELYRISPDRIAVLLSGVDGRFAPVTDQTTLRLVREKYGIGMSPYIFSVGTVQPRKNYVRLIKALAALRMEKYDIHLVIAGGKGWLDNPIYRAIDDTHMNEFVHMIGFVDEADLPALYSEATCFAFPSLYEGFGLPVLEAMGCRTPVVTSNISSLPEAAGDAALMVDPYNLDAITTAIKQVIDDEALRGALIRKGVERSKQFTWDRAAQQLGQIYRDLPG